MAVKFLGQPFSDDAQFGRVLEQALADEDSTSFWATSAWAKRSGLSRLGPHVLALRERGGSAEAIVGIDEGGATREGLQLARQLFDIVYVFHDVGPRTFHPKLYAVEGPERATVVLGSGNLTRGGLFTNFEAGVVLDLQKIPGSDDLALLEQIRAYFDALTGAGPSCRELTEETVNELVSNPRYRVGSETRQNKRKAVARAEREALGPGLFGDPLQGLASAPLPDIPPLPDDDEDDDTPPAPPAQVGQAEGPTADAFAGGIGPAAWDKKLSVSDAQRKPKGNQRGSITLVKAAHDIDPQTYFRFDLFEPANWVLEHTVTDQVRETAQVPFEVTLLGNDLGVLVIPVSYAANREADQKNYTSLLHLGALAPYFQAEDLRDRHIEIERRADGTFALTIS